MTSQGSQRRLVIRWTTLKGLAAIIIFLVIAALVEFFAVLYAMNLGVKDETQLRWSLSGFMVVISPLFHLVPVAVIISLLSSWIYLTRHMAVKPAEKQKGKLGAVTKSEGKHNVLGDFFGKVKAGLLKVRGIGYVWQKIHFARATIRSALTVLLVFFTITIVVSLLTYPQLIFQIITGAYQNDPSLLSFVRGVDGFFSPLNGVYSAIRNALLAAAPSFGNAVLGLGSVIRPLADLDNSGKYLVFQNIAAWVSALAALFYGEYVGKSYRHRKTK